MRVLKSFKARVLRFVLPIALAFAMPISAYADQCDWNDTKQAFSDLSSSVQDFAKQCTDELDDPAYWAMAIFLAAGAVGNDIAETGSDPSQAQPNYITQFCRDAVNEINNGAGKTVQDIIDKLPDSVKQTVTDALNSVLGDTASTDLASVASAFTCACQSITLNGLSELGGVVGSCIHDVECQASHNTIECCPQTPTQPIKIDCSLPPCSSQFVYFPQPDPNQPGQNCTNGPSLISAGQGESIDACYNTVWLNPHCFGETCYSADPNRPPDNNQTYVCSCPVAMQLHMNETMDGGYISCGCPPGSTQQGDQCVCPDGKSTLSWNGGNVAGNCPPVVPPPPKPVCAPTCGAGQTVKFTDEASCQYSCQCQDGQVSVGGSCVTPCSGGEVMLEGGTCCKAAQATSCGVCCPDGMMPDASGATCVVRRLPVNNQTKPNAPKPGQSLKPNVEKP